LEYRHLCADQDKDILWSKIWAFPKLEFELMRQRSLVAQKELYMTSCRRNSELPLSSATWSNIHDIWHYNSFESYPVLGSSSNLDEVQFQTIHNRPPKLVNRQLGYLQAPQVACNSTLEKKAKVSCWRTATTTSRCCGSTTVRGSRLFPRMTSITS